MEKTSEEDQRSADARRVEEHDVVIVGGGFAGVAAAKSLGKAGVDVLLLDQNSYHQFQPLLYQVATSQIAVSTVARPLRSILRREREHVSIRAARVESIDAAKKTVTTSDGIHYQGRILVVASGAEPNFFNTPGAEEHAYPLYSIDDATRLSSALLGALERASATRDASNEQAKLAVAVVGAGPNGVETAGAIAENIRYVVAKYHSEQFAAESCEVHLVDMVDTVLPPFSKASQKYTRTQLKKLGVHLHLGSAVSSVSATELTLAEGTAITAGIVIWAGGLKASHLLGPAGFTTGRGGRVDVNPDLTVPGFPGVYVLGDTANIVDAKGRALPQLGSVAKQSGNWAAKNIQAELSGGTRTDFGFLDMGYMAMIGRGKSVAELTPRRYQLQGPLAFLAWLGVHVMLLSGWQQKIGAVVSWFRDYFTSSRPQVVVHQPEVYEQTRRHGPTTAIGESSGD